MVVILNPPSGRDLCSLSRGLWSEGGGELRRGAMENSNPSQKCCPKFEIIQRGELL